MDCWKVPVSWDSCWGVQSRPTLLVARLIVILHSGSPLWWRCLVHGMTPDGEQTLVLARQEFLVVVGDLAHRCRAGEVMSTGTWPRNSLHPLASLHGHVRQVAREHHNHHDRSASWPAWIRRTAGFAGDAAVFPVSLGFSGPRCSTSWSVWTRRTFMAGAGDDAMCGVFPFRLKRVAALVVDLGMFLMGLAHLLCRDGFLENCHCSQAATWHATRDGAVSWYSSPRLHRYLRALLCGLDSVLFLSDSVDGRASSGDGFSDLAAYGARSRIAQAFIVGCTCARRCATTGTSPWSC